MAEDVEGLYVISIEGTELVARDNPYRLLRNLSGSSVRMMVSQRPSAIGAREVAFEPLRDETELEYLSWVEGRMRLVAERSGGRVGYLHIPDMGEKGLVAFIRGLSGQLRHDALVVDVRSNSGGWLSSTMLERLRREVLFVRFGRTTGMETYPSRTFHGPLCCIVNERTASDGEVFAEAFRRSGLGRLVGRRTWGGTIGVMDRGKLLDGGTVLVPEFALTHLDGSLAIEGRGVQPDVEVENDPASLARGQDRQLERAVDLLLEELRTELHPLPERPTDSRVAPNGNQ
jgi:tricorn protease